MTNAEKYKTAQERAKAFQEFLDYMCYKQRCSECKLRPCGLPYERSFVWLDLEAEEEKPLPCPFCGNEMDISASYCAIVCPQCGYRSPLNSDVKTAIAAHNKVAKKCME